MMLFNDSEWLMQHANGEWAVPMPISTNKNNPALRSYTDVIDRPSFHTFFTNALLCSVSFLFYDTVI